MKQPRAKTPSNLSVANQRHLSAYATAATAAGVGILALATPADAEIVYTPAHRILGAEAQPTPGYKLDLNGDGIPDFELVNSTFGHGGNQSVKPAGNNQVMGAGIYAFALASGAAIGPNGAFQSATFMANWIDSSGSITVKGLWANTRNRYLGFKFLIDGEYHFGWARMSIHDNHMKLDGYAYNTVANQPIKAGQESESGAAANISPTHSGSLTATATLGRLAQGAAGLAAWRREDIDAVA
jgi:hypothetical protein